uniref:Rossmann 2x3 fold protein n=1 Tax=synthetic construct TaxID=32630 RepID=UPI0001F2FE46|nr:Chain A, Rossmann 2x3 fold protein [synthetic construct]
MNIVIVVFSTDEETLRKFKDIIKKNGFKVRTVRSPQELKDSIEELVKKYNATIVVVVVDDKEWAEKAIRFVKSLGAQVLIIIYDQDQNRLEEFSREVRRRGFEVRTVTSPDDFKKSLERLIREVGSLEHHHHHH